MMLCEMISWSLQEMWDFMLRESRPMSLCLTLFCNLYVVELTLCYQLMVFACW
jgi:hypothetical protein